MRKHVRSLSVLMMILGTMGTAKASKLAPPADLWFENPYAWRAILNADTTFVFYVTYNNTAWTQRIRYMGYPIAITPQAPTVYADMHVRKIVDSEDDVHIVWMRKRTIGTWSIYYAEIDPTNTFKVNPTRISDVSSHPAEYPAIALDSNDDAHVVWMDLRNVGTWEIYYSKIGNNTGTDLTIPDVRVSDDLTTNSGRVVDPPTDTGENCTYIEHPDIAVDSDDNVHIVWSDQRYAAHWEVYYQKQDNAAIPVVLINDAPVSRQDNAASQCPAVAVGKNNEVHIVWQDARDLADWEVYYQRQDSNGNVLGGFGQARRSGPDDGFNSAMPDIDAQVGPPGNPENYLVHIVFMDQRDQDPNLRDSWHIDGNWEIYAAILESDGYPLAGNFGVPKRHSDIYGGTQYGSQYSGNTDGDGHSMYPQIAVEDIRGGETYFKWHDYRDGNWEIYDSHVHNWCGNPQADVRVTVNDSADMYPSIALDKIDMYLGRSPDNKWQSNRTGKWRIYNARKEQGQWILLHIAMGGDTISYDMCPEPGDYDASDGILYSYGRPISWGENFYFRCTAKDTLGNENSTAWTPVINATAVGDGVPVPAGFSLAQNFPNPFNPTTEIRYELPVDCTVSLKLYNVAGRKVATLVDKYERAGKKTARWNGRDDGGKAMSSGVYFYRLLAGNYSETRKMILLK